MISKVMLAARLDKDPAIAMSQLKRLRYPVLVSNKYDGIRCHIYDSVSFSRKNKKIPNEYIQNILSYQALCGLDGELIVNSPTSPVCYNTSQSGVMSQGGEPDFTYNCFDYTMSNLGFFDRLAIIKDKVFKFGHPRVKYVPHKFANSYDELMMFEEKAVLAGWEGIMIRGYDSPYKQGRSTLNEQWLIKVKRHEESEAEILGVYEQQTNLNEAKINELGYSKRSSHQHNKVNNGRLGGFFVRDIVSGVEFDLGTFSGFTQEWRSKTWQVAETLIGKIVKYKFFPVGVKDKPRQPILIGFRDPIDMGE